jgi:hypothetical protein
VDVLIVSHIVVVEPEVCLKQLHHILQYIIAWNRPSMQLRPNTISRSLLERLTDIESAKKLASVSFHFSKRHRGSSYSESAVNLYTEAMITRKRVAGAA